MIACLYKQCNKFILQNDLIIRRKNITFTKTNCIFLLLQNEKTMNNIFKILAVIGTGIAVGSVAGKLLSFEKLKNLRAVRSRIQVKSGNMPGILRKPEEDQDVHFI